MKLRLGWALLAGLAAAAWAADRKDARFYYDLGPDEVDISGYSDQAKIAYPVFKTTCSRCHTLARPLNSPTVAREDWERYVKRMHLKTTSKKGTAFSKEEAKAILTFLTEDSKRRKVDQKAAFETKTKELQSSFKELEKERERQTTENALQRAKDQTDPGGVHPQPAPDERR
ncbi:MAG: hypothetical protein HY925_09215 [Elusimicrobia bacterium]|nr:hypothetical protein [Elusimicrobiota bacterium]